MKGNSVSIKGNVTRNVEVRRTQSGKNVLRFGLAWNQSKPDGNGGYADVPHYFDVSCFATDKQAAIVQPHIVKGARCAIIDGRLDYYEWDKDGEKRRAVQIVVEDPIASLLVWKPAQAQNGPQAASQPPVAQPQPSNQNYVQGAQWTEVPNVYDDDIPF